MTSPDQRDSASAVAAELLRRLALPIFVFAGTLSAYALATGTNVCQVCPPKPVSSAFPWAVSAALFVLALQSFRAGRRKA